MAEDENNRTSKSILMPVFFWQHPAVSKALSETTNLLILFLLLSQPFGFTSFFKRHLLDIEIKIVRRRKEEGLSLERHAKGDATWAAASFSLPRKTRLSPPLQSLLAFFSASSRRRRRRRRRRSWTRRRRRPSCTYPCCSGRRWP